MTRYRTIKRLATGGFSDARQSAGIDHNSYGGGGNSGNGSTHGSGVTVRNQTTGAQRTAAQATADRNAVAAAQAARAASGSGAGNSTVADYGTAQKYINSPAEGVPDMQHYWNGVSNLGKRYSDYKDYNNSVFDNLGNALLGALSVGEMDPTKQTLGASVDNPTADYGVDPLGLVASGAGMVSGLPLGSLYQLAKKATGLNGPVVAFGGNNYIDPFGGDSSPIAPGMGVVDADKFQSALTSFNNGGGSFNSGAQPSHLGPGAGQGSNPSSALAAMAAATPAGLPGSTQLPPSTPPATTPSTPADTSGRTFNPYTDDYFTYGQRPEHQFFTYPTAMASGGYVDSYNTPLDSEQERHFRDWKRINAPHDSGRDYDLRGAFAAGLRPSANGHWSDRFKKPSEPTFSDESQYAKDAPDQVGHWNGDDFIPPRSRRLDQEPVQYKSFGGFLKKLVKTVAPAAIGLGTSALTGSDILGGLAGGASSKLFGNDWLTAGLTGLGTGAASALTGLSGDGGGLGSDAANAIHGGGEGGGLFSSALDWAKDNPLAIGGSALALASALGGKHSASSQSANLPAGASADDPAYASQIRNGGWQWNRKPTDTSAVNWYQYGQMPEWDFFTDENSFSPVASKAHGGAIPGQQQSALGGLHDMGGMADGPGGGQDDKIPVYLSAKEYVVPADVVSDLGDGNPDQGAKKLDVLRDKVRKQKGRRGFPPKAKEKVSAYL